MMKLIRFPWSIFSVTGYMKQIVICVKNYVMMNRNYVPYLGISSSILLFVGNNSLIHEKRRSKVYF